MLAREARSQFRPGFFIDAPAEVPSLPVKEKEGDMKILNVILMIKKIIALDKKAKTKSREKNLTVTGHSDVRHPAEFLVRW